MSGPPGAASTGSWEPSLPPGLLAGSRRRGGVWFTVALTVAMVLGGVVMAFVLLASSAPDALVVGALLAVLPVGPVVACFIWLDRYEPEPVKLLVFAFGWGALVATAGALVLQLLDQAVLGSTRAQSVTVVAPITEEAAKGLFILLLLWARRHHIDGLLDGIVYGGLVGAGFAFTENILYLGSAYMGGEGLGAGGIGSAAGVFVVRGIFSPFAHPVFTVCTGLGLGYAATRRGWARLLVPVAGYLVAVMAHAAWNGSAYAGGGRFFVVAYLFLMVPAFLLLAGFAIWARRREAQMLTRALGDAASRGFLNLHEVPWLVRLPARRVSRRHARRTGGPPAARVMERYQQSAVELGFLHDRFLRGTPPSDFAERGTVLVQRMAALRPYVLYPGAAAPGPLPVRQGGS